MLNTSKIIAFAATADADKSKDFYKNVLGLPLMENTHFALVFDANGTSLRIQKTTEVRPPGYTVLGWEVASTKETIKTLADKGVSFKHFLELNQNAQGVWQTPDGAQVAWFSDPDGNLCSLTEFNKMPK